MKYGVVLPGGDPLEQIELAVAAEKAGWDGLFVAELAYGIDAWTLLGAMAVRTQTLRLGTLLTPLPWRRPWKVASQAMTLDRISGGRAILSIGLGAPDAALGDFGEESARSRRAEHLDDGLDLMAALWDGSLEFEGQHVRMNLEHRFDRDNLPMPVQQPRVPIWVVGAWPKPKSMRRVLRADGLLPNVFDETVFRPAVPADIVAMIAWLDDNGGRRPGFDVVSEGETPADDAAQAAGVVAPWEAAGATWWIESRWTAGMEAIKERVAAGPPRATR
ncbi:MAG: hypothetical protein QOG03_2029 [Actinomycetota bacterium]|jgi:alkanesulfonate monooxygenase SsuD/methylene tetrahydromethanopterin reductase-like flavin-dependent oxidoreductase (luciferase family)|nr:hypothetical protein [Actinomycetota bacterium]